ncbi:MAG TPA: FAD-dependent oxidoreductase, partial [Chitinophagaceae bacterium]
MDRRKFISLSVAITGSTALISACKNKKKIRGSIVGTSSEVGHKLRNGNFDEPVRISKHQVVIIGAGISGLTAAYYLKKNGISDFVLLDLEKVPGGNSRHDENQVSSYPWGAHYIPIANNDLTEYIDFLKECNAITGFDENGQPVYNEEFLCFDPEERLYINGKWQDGIIPQFGVPDDDKKQIERFLQLVDTYRLKKGKDGKDAFAIPVDKSSKDPEFTILDSITMEQWMQKQGFISDYLHWYVNYCTRDDFGTRHKDISAWMGIHYFASRKGSAANASYHNILTWPEGNGFLVKELNRNTGNAFKSGCLAVAVSEADGMVRVTYLDTNDN